LTPNLPTIILHHGTTLRRAREIEANGPDPNYREPGSEQLPPAEGFSTVIGDGPDWIMAILYADPIAAGLARSGEIRFEPESGLNELRAEWHNLTKRVIPL
jgi:hypothetical protein